ncbi:MAG: hypothetical protein K0B14_10460 [Anaerolineaceae bacterium]|nr:hypothetical protein [Anaerolineaceae bacterium]
MFFHCIEFAGGGVGATGLVGDRIGGSVLGGEGNRPPQVGSVLANPGFDEVTTIVIFGHTDLVPGDGNLIAIPAGAHILWGTVHVGTNGLQIRDDVAYSVEITNHIDNRVRDPAPVVELVELNMQPFGVGEATTHRASITGV